MKLGYIIVYVEDVKETMRFYQQAFELSIKLEYENEGTLLYGEMDTEGAILGFASHKLGKLNLGGNYQKVSLQDRPIGQEIVFVSQDVHACYAKAVSMGAVSIAEPIQKPWGQTVAYVRGIEGALIEICSPMEP